MIKPGKMEQLVLICAATQAEIGILGDIKSFRASGSGYTYRQLNLIPLVTGVGSVTTVWSLMNYISLNQKPDIAINIGIAGSFSDKYSIGSVLISGSDTFGDLGIENGVTFKSLWETGLSEDNESLQLLSEVRGANDLRDIGTRLFPAVRAVTVNTVTGSDESRLRLVNKFNPDIETMEGAAFYYVCSREGIRSISMRSVSNKVGSRKRDSWELGTALENLSKGLESFLDLLTE